MAAQGRGKGWLSSLLGGGPADPPGTRYELIVLEGADSGSVYLLEEAQVPIGRRIPGETLDGIELTDRSVSARHALISQEDGRLVVEHLPSATNPTLVNGRRVKRKRVRSGDRIVLGLVVLELRARRPQAELVDPGAGPGDISTDPVNVQGELVLRDGVEALEGERFPLIRRRTAIGRDTDCDIVVEVAAVSRNHAALVWEDDHLVLIHESSVNPTHVNGMEVRDRRRLFHGDEIALSERVRFEVMLDVASQPAAGAAGGTSVGPDAEATLLTRAHAVPEEESTRLTSPPLPQTRPHTRPAADDADATRLTSPELHEPADDDAEATRISAPAAESNAAASAASPASAPTPPPAADELPGETRIFDTPAPDSFRDGDATRIAPVPTPTPPAGDETRIADAPESAAFADADATRIAPVPERAPFADGDATRIAPAPERAPFADGDATRIAPSPIADASTDPLPDAERRQAPADTDPPPSDAEKTVIRPAAAPEVDDAARTVIRQSPAQSGPRDSGDADATIIRPRPGAPTQPMEAGETRILEPDDEPDEEDA